jgi:hypothetical protein
MKDQILIDFIESLYQDIIEAMKVAEESDSPQYRLGVRRLAKSFFDNIDLFHVDQIIPTISKQDVDAWYAGR